MINRVKFLLGLSFIVGLSFGFICQGIAEEVDNLLESVLHEGVIARCSSFACKKTGGNKK